MVKNPPANAGDTRDAGLIPGSGRSPGGGNGNPLQYSCLGNPMDRGACGLQSMAEQRVRPDWETADTNTQVYKHFLRMPTQCQVAVQSFRNSRMNKARGWLSETLTFGEVKFHGG